MPQSGSDISLTESIGNVFAVGYPQGDMEDGRYDVLAFKKDSSGVFFGLITLFPKDGYERMASRDTHPISSRNNFVINSTRLRTSGGIWDRHPAFYEKFAQACVEESNISGLEGKYYSHTSTFDFCYPGADCRLDWTIQQNGDLALPLNCSSKLGIYLSDRSISLQQRKAWELIEQGCKAEMEEKRALLLNWERIEVRALTDKDDIYVNAMGIVKFNEGSGYFNDSMVRN